MEDKEIKKEEMQETEVALPKFLFKKKKCFFCKEKRDIDYKDSKLLARFVSDRGKILPRRITGTCAMHQRKLKVAIKRARYMALLPYVSIEKIKI